jgi:ferredoxin
LNKKKENKILPEAYGEPEYWKDRVKKREDMKVRVDQNKCRTYGQCVEICPEVFRFLPGSKKAAVVMSEVPRHLQSACIRAAACCSACAIIVID